MRRAVKRQCGHGIKRHIADDFTQIGRYVTWQELGEGFENHCFRFQVLDQGDYVDRDWRDDLNRMLQLPQEAAP